MDSSKKSKASEKDQHFPLKKFISRADWGAKPPKWIESLELPVAKVVVSFTETGPCYSEEDCIPMVRRLQEAHMAEKDVPDIKHNLLIGGDGTVYEGRGYTRVGPVYLPTENRVELLNHSSIDIGIIGPKSRIIGDLMKGVTTCVQIGMERKLIDKDFETYYLMNNDIAYVHSDKQNRIKKMKEEMAP